MPAGIEKLSVLTMAMGTGCPGVQVAFKVVVETIWNVVVAPPSTLVLKLVLDVRVLYVKADVIADVSADALAEMLGDVVACGAIPMAK